MIKLFCRHKDKDEIDKHYKCHQYPSDTGYNLNAYIVYKCNDCKRVYEKRVMHEYVNTVTYVKLCNELKKKGYKDDYTYKMEQLSKQI